MLTEFKGFLTTTNALALAVGVIIGAAVADVVSAMAADILMPIVGLFLPGGDWREAKFILQTTTDASGKISQSAILYGHFIGTLLNFLLISLVVFLIVKALVRPPGPARKCPECLETIAADARRCRSCTAIIAAI
ncbi:MAG TPA: large conductance mechanosensitive channel protein MscL [Thermoanaerobaculia bacterium]|nr:large conductance mechanosensitive channel protein MscL [Thermoanaerobaculia bacterium]